VEELHVPLHCDMMQSRLQLSLSFALLTTIATGGDSLHFASSLPQTNIASKPQT
jgi:hypothetical protein